MKNKILQYIILYLVLTVYPLFAAGIHAVIGKLQYSDGTIPGQISWSAWITERPGEVLTFDSGDMPASASVYDIETGGFLLQCSGFSSWTAGEILHVDFTDGLDGLGTVEVELTYNAWDSAGTVKIISIPDPHPVTGKLKYIDNTIPQHITWNARITARPGDVLSFDSNDPVGTESFYNSSTGDFSIECTEFSEWNSGETLNVEFSDPDGVTAEISVVLTGNPPDNAGTVWLDNGPPEHPVTGSVIYENDDIPASISWSAYITSRPLNVITFDSRQPGPAGSYNSGTGAFSIECSEFNTWNPAETLHVEMNDNADASAAFHLVLGSQTSDDAGVIVLQSGPGEHQIIGNLVYADHSIPSIVSWDMYITARPNNIVHFESNNQPDTGSEYHFETGAFMLECSELTTWSPGETLRVDFADGLGATASLEVTLSENFVDEAGTVTLLKSTIERYVVVGNIRYDDYGIPASISWNAFIASHPNDVQTFDSRIPLDTLALYNPETGDFLLDLHVFGTWHATDTLCMDIHDHLYDKSASIRFGLSGSETDSAGTVVLTGISDVETGTLPSRFELMQNYPNPFNPETVITYRVAVAQQVNLRIFNSLGQAVRTLVYGPHLPGEFQVVWDGKDDTGHSLPSGTYVYILSGGQYRETLKAVLLK